MEKTSHNYQVCVLICTRNRAKHLSKCLTSLVKQTTKANKVIVVDNGSCDHTSAVCSNYAKRLNLVYVFEKTIGLSYARNASLKNAKGDILAFIDDDCVADPNWILNIQKHFTQYPNSSGVLGLSHNAHPKNPYSVVEYIFYLRWMRQNVKRIAQVNNIQSGRFIDFKNAAFKQKVFKTLRFSLSVPSGDVGMMEDVEIGDRITTVFPHIYYSPDICIYHTYSSTISRLLFRNFWEGYGNEILLMKYDINLRLTPYTAPLWGVLLQIVRTGYGDIKLSPYVFFLCLCFPIFSRAGRLYAKIAYQIHVDAHIPQRK